MEVDNKQEVAEVSTEPSKETADEKQVKKEEETKEATKEEETKVSAPEKKETETKEEKTEKSENNEEKEKEADKPAESAESEDAKADAESEETAEESSEQTPSERKGRGKKAKRVPAKKEKSNADAEDAVTFKGGDVVWVRITRLGWWPALVMKNEDLPADFGAIHPSTLAVVKFFNEEEFEEISKLDRLQPYNCDSKLNHIKVGMTKFLEFQKRQAKNSQYVNFPVSVEEAEKLTNGDVSLAEPEKYDTKKETPAEKQRGRRKRRATEDEDDEEASPAEKNGEASNGKKTKREGSLSLSEDDNNDSLSKDPEYLASVEQVLKDIVNMYILTDECLEHLKSRVSDEGPSERYSVFCRDQRHLSLKMATVGFFEGFYDLYSNVADFLTVNVKKVKTLSENQHDRNFILNVLVPEAITYGISKNFSLSLEEADNYTMFGIRELVSNKK